MLGSKDLDPAVRMRMDAIDRNFRDLTKVVHKIPTLTCPDDLSADLRENLEALNERRSSLTKRLSDLCEPVFQVLGNLGDRRREDPPMGELLAAVATVKDARLIELEEAVKITLAGQELAPRIAAEIEPIAIQLQAQYEETLVAVKEDLERIGQGVSATQTSRRGGQGTPAAKRAFHFLATLNDRSVSAFVLAHDIKNRLASVKESAAKYKNAGVEIREQLTRLVVGELRI